MKERIFINPNDIIYRSSLQGSPQSWHKTIKIQGLTYDNGYVNGDWDINCRLFKESRYYKDLELYIKYGHEKASKLYSGYYNWDSLFKSIKENGYVQKEDKRAVEVALSRNNEYLFVDGRHRLAISQFLKLEKIPVQIVYIHSILKQ